MRPRGSNDQKLGREGQKALREWGGGGGGGEKGKLKRLRRKDANKLLICNFVI